MRQFLYPVKDFNMPAMNTVKDPNSNNRIDGREKGYIVEYLQTNAVKAQAKLILIL